MKRLEVLIVVLAVTLMVVMAASSTFAKTVGKSVTNGLVFLAGEQKVPEGYWEYCPGCPYPMPGRVGTTGLAVLAFINDGRDPDTHYNVIAGLSYILSQTKGDGSIYYATPADGFSFPVYETSIAIYALVAAWVVSTSPPAEWKEAIINAVDYLMDPNVHLSSGGWGYQTGGAWYQPGWVDLSNTQFAVLALRAVLETRGILGKEIPDAALEYKLSLHLSEKNTTNYISSCQKPNGGFIYRFGGYEYSGGAPYGSMTAAGIWSLFCCNVPDTDSKVLDGKTWFNNNYSYNSNPVIGQVWLYYYLMTAAKAFTMYDWTDFGAKTVDWYADFTNFLLNDLDRGQNADGSWGPIPNLTDYIDVGGEPKSVATAQAILALQTKTPLPYGVLDVFLGTEADLHLYDAESKHVGINYATGQVDLEIPGSYYSGPGTDPQEIKVSAPKGGGYRIGIVGKTPETYTLTVNGYMNTTLIYSKTATDTISVGETKEYRTIVANIVGPLNIDLKSIAPAIISATIDIDPDTLNLKSQGRWITAYIELPAGYDPDDIDLTTVRRVRITRIGGKKVGSLYAESHPCSVGDHDLDGIPDLMVKFDRQEVQSHIMYNSEGLPISVEFALKDGTLFSGIDQVRIIHGIWPDQEGKVTLVNNLINPTSDETVLFCYILDEPSTVSIKIYTIRGELIKILFDEELKSAGDYREPWDGTTADGSVVTSGAYLVYIEINGEQEMKRVVVLK